LHQKKQVYLVFRTAMHLESPEMEIQTVHEWLDRLGNAWRNLDSEAAADLFTVNAVYRSQPFRASLLGRPEIAGYWASATRNQAGIEVKFGDPVVDGNRVAVEWWAIVNEKGQPSTEAGGLFLVFENGLCAELREYWNLIEGKIPVPQGWGR
jgi:ketosteroid isomerase-like protein